MIDSKVLKDLGWSDELIKATEEAAGFLETENVGDLMELNGADLYIEPSASGDILLDEQPVASQTLRLR